VQSQWKEKEFGIPLCSSSCHRDGHPAFNRRQTKIKILSKCIEKINKDISDVKKLWRLTKRISFPIGFLNPN
jgi:hypothetical protein